MGKIVHKTRKPLGGGRVVVRDQMDGKNALGRKCRLDLGRDQTAWTWLPKLRRTIVRPGHERLGGVIAVDERYGGGADSEGR